jgi:hypothetical protein
MISMRKAGVVVAAGLLVGCAGNKKQPPRAAAPEPQPMQAAEQLRSSLVRANPNARVGIVAATVGRFAAVRDVPAGAVAEDATVQILDAGGEVIGYGLVRAVKNDTIHVLYQGDTRRGPQVGDLVMPASDAGVPVEEMPAGAPMQRGDQQAAEPSRLPPRRGQAPAEAMPADATAPAAQDAAQQPAAQPAAAPKEEAQPAPGATEPAKEPAAEPAKEPAAEPAKEPAAEPAKEPAKPTEPSPGDTNGTAAEPAAKDKSAEKAADKAPAPEAAKDGAAAGDAAPAPADDKAADKGADKAAEGEKPGLNK